MPRPKIVAPCAFAGLLLAIVLCAAEALAARAPAPAQAPGDALRARFERMRGEIEHNGFGRPLRLTSREGDHVLEGDVYALVDHPFGEVEESLHEARQWCDVLVLPFNVKRCEAGRRGGAERLGLYIARRKDSTAEDAYRLDLRFESETQDAGYMRIALAARSGPLGTHDYRIVLEAAPADARRTVLHLTYSYGYGMLSQMAMQAYLSTAGADHVGFTMQGRDRDGRPVLVGGMRGVMERNTMRYFLAIEAYLASLAAPPGGREEARLKAWFDAVERYPRQLHEASLEEYLAMKHRELRASRAPRTASSWP